MKKNALVAFGLLVSLVSAGAVVGQDVTVVSEISVSESAGVTAEQARKTALQRVPGEIQDEYTLEDDDEKVTAYVFVIKDKNKKVFEVQVDAKSGKITSVEEQKEEPEDSEDPPVTDENEAPEPEENEAPQPEETETTEETDSTETDSTESEEVESEEVSDETNSTKEEVAPQPKQDEYKFTMEQARAKALKKAKGEIQSEELIQNDGKAYYAFMIKGKKDKITEVRVDANSGKAKKFKNKTAKTEE